MKKLLVVVILLFVTLFTKAQNPLVQYSEITFTSPFEKKVLDDHFLQKKTDLFLLFMANGGLLREASIIQNRDRFYAHLESLQTEKLAGKKNDKKAKLIYDDIHKTYFQKYEVQKNFEDVFFNGNYNTYSASAVYGLAFEKLEIPYTIKEEQTSVYLIAYPDAERIKVETTSPLGGFITFDQTFKQNYVKLLKEQKVISAQEYASKDMNMLFDQYYFGNQMGITLLNLVGLQYMNDAMRHLELGQYQDAFTQLEKTYLFYPSDRCGYLLTVAGTQALEGRKEKDSLHASYLSKLSRYKTYGVTSEMIQGEFGNVMQELLYKSGQRAALDSYYRQLESGIQDIQIKTEITFLYQYEIGRLLYNQARFKESIPYFESALKAKPKHVDTNNALVSALTQSALRVGGNYADLINTLEKYVVDFPTLQENNIFNSLLASAYLNQFGIEYSQNKPAEGDTYKKRFEEYYKRFSDLTLDGNLVAQSYSAAAVYYFRRNQTSKAKSLISQGLVYSPNNYELLMRQQAIK